ncbi:hypothetical protein SDC9_153101 [bioreactor metagenome]|uniref:Uncharacterized protein n=1 Tax=bioreactor metagenome TaxID=1076179 RepID=A0A645EVH0_9ZZZZ
MCCNDNLDLVMQSRLKACERQLPVRGQRNVFNSCFLQSGYPKPRQDTAGMLALGTEHHIAFLKILHAETVGRQIKCRCITGSKDNFLRLTVDEISNIIPRPIISRADRKRIIIVPAMNVGGIVRIVMQNGIDDRLRFKCRCPVIQINQLFAGLI